MTDKVWRARIGYNTPRRVIDTEAYEFYQVAPKDVMLVANHLNVRESSNIDEARAAFALIDASVDSLIEARVDFIMQWGAPVHLVEGNEGHRRLLERLRAKSSVPVTTTAQATLEAFQHLSAKRILQVSTWPVDKPYPMWAWKAFLSEGGIELVNIKPIQHGFLSIGKGSITPTQIYEQLKAGLSESPEAEAVYLQSGTLRAVGLIDAWEAEIKRPIVSANNASIWGCFRPFKITVGRGYGRLLASLG